MIAVISIKDFINAWNEMSGIIDYIYLYLHGGSGKEGNNVAWKLAKLSNSKVFACTGSVSYSKIFGKYYARKAWDWGIIKTFYYQKQYIYWGPIVAKSAAGQW